MSAPRPWEEQVLAPVERAIRVATARLGASDHATRLEILEGVASQLGGVPPDELRSALGAAPRHAAATVAGAARGVVDALRAVPVHPALALSSLARPPLDAMERRKAGVYYTDFRLARLVVERLALPSGAGGAVPRVLDPACGTGILLAATAVHVGGSDRGRLADFLRRGVHGADLAPAALRGARLALASLTDDVEAIGAMAARLRELDSLLGGRAAWAADAPEGFDAVVGNPPWEKLKVSRHEFLRAEGVSRHYGHDYAEAPLPGIADAQAEVARYGARIAALYPAQADGEPDLYKVFLELSCGLVRDGGALGILVPAGLIRSQGTRGLRAALLDRASRLSIAVVDNRARFFAIDTRFKFLVVHAGLAGRGGHRSDLRLDHVAGTPEGTEVVGTAHLPRPELRRLRPDLTVPEVRSDAEWRIFGAMAEAGGPFGDPSGPWRPRIVREVDMTRHRLHFRRAPGPGCVPVVEGRMVHQYRFGAKAYVSGTGRRARWRPLDPCAVAPQFWIPTDSVGAAVRERMGETRVGFCDITGQTNERTLLAALVPPGVVCGNKVPTVTFHGRSPEATARLWLAVANSVPFDWLLRRVVTTTVNYFLLLGLPLPRLDVESLPARRLIELADALGAEGVDPWEAALCRAEIDARVANAYGLGLADLRTLLADFPLLDRGQPPLPGEARSTITRDLLLARAAALWGEPAPAEAARVEPARALGAVAYVPSELGAGWEAEDEEEVQDG